MGDELCGQNGLSNRNTTLFSTPIPSVLIASRFCSDRGGLKSTLLSLERPLRTPKGSVQTTKSESKVLPSRAVTRQKFRLPFDSFSIFRTGVF